MTGYFHVLIAAIKFSLRLLALSFVHLLGFIVAAQLTGVVDRAEMQVAEAAADQDQQTQVMAGERRQSDRPSESRSAATQAQSRMLGTIAAVCVLNSAVLMIWIQRSTLYGLTLVAFVFVVFLMCMTVMPQSETLFFLPQAQAIVRQGATVGLVVCALFSLAAVPAMHRWRKPHAERRSDLPRGDTVTCTLWRLALCALGYVALYLVFGYFVAWQNPDVRALYGGGELPGFFSHLASRPVSTRLIPFQFARGIVWTILCLGLMRYSQGNRFGQAIIIGLVLAVLMNAQLLIPNPMMSRGVRITHLIETASSNFLFGFLCVLFWSNSQRRR